MPKPKVDDDTVVWYTDGVGKFVGTVHILESGWLRVHHLDDDSITYESPFTVARLTGPGVIYSDQ
jgi:hypothetical protein